MTTVPDFPQTIPPDTLLGRTGIDAGPVQSLPFSFLQGLVIPAPPVPGSPATTYYVTTTGNDNNSGTSQATAWATITRVNAATFNPGDVVLFKGGQTFSGAIVSPSSGTPATPITFGSYGGGQATISSGTSDGFSSTNQAGIIVRDLIFTGSSSTNRGIHFDNTGPARLQNVQVIDCTVSGYGFDGIYFHGSSAGFGYDHILIDGCTVSACASHTGAGIAGTTVVGIQTAAAGLLPAAHTNVTIRNCISHNNAGTTDVAITGNGIIVEETTNALVHNCLAYSNGASANPAAAGIWCNDCVNVTFDTCTSHDTGSASGVDGEGFDIDVGSVGCTIRNCLSYNNFGPGYLVIGNTASVPPAVDHASVINNVSINDCAGVGANLKSIEIHTSNTGAVTNVTISGNKVYQSTGGTQCIGGGGGGTSSITGTVTGNTFAISGAQNFIDFTNFNPTGLLFTNNEYRSAGAASFKWAAATYTSLKDFITATGQESAGRIMGVAQTFTLYGSIPVLVFHDTETNGSEYQLEVGLNGTNPIFSLSLNKSPTFPDFFTVNWDNAGSFQLMSGAVHGWTTSATSSFATMDTGISRVAPVSSVPTIAIGNGAPADASGTIKAKSKAGAPTTGDVPAGTWVLIRDTTNNTTKVYYNNAGALMSVALV